MFSSNLNFSHQPKDFIFADKETTSSPPKKCWNILVVDDEPDVHKITRMVFENFIFEDKSLNIVHAYSGKEAIEAINKKEFALILLDVVMEQKNSGLQVVEYIRKELKNNFTRIILRTGQPGEAPEEKIIFEYEINDYLEKGDISSRRLKTVVVNSLRNYDILLKQEESSRRQKELAETLEKANYRLKKISLEKSKFLTFLSHETLTPLNYIGASNIIDRSNLSAEDSQYFEFITTGSARLHQVIKVIIDYFDIIGRDLKLKTKNFPISSSLSNTIENFSTELKEKQLDIRLDLPENFSVSFDFRYFAQVIKLLLDNAIKFSKSDGCITIKGWKKDNISFLSIADQGVGLSKEKLSRVFKAYDLENFDRHESGFGLNLPIIKYIIESHNDEIQIDSKGIDQGATVTIKFNSNLPSQNI